jgi:hypothetical protein
MHKAFALFSLCIAAIICMGCGTLAGRTKSAMGIQAESLKIGVPFEIVDKKGTVVASGVTPAVVTLPNGAFGANKYTIQYKSKSGQDAEKLVKCTFDSSVFFAGLRVLGGQPFMLVDLFSGAMFKLTDVATLQEIAYHPGMNLAIGSIEDVNLEIRQYLIPIGRLDVELETE